MQAHDENSKVPVTKDAENERAIPSVWRPVLAGIVEAFVRHDYLLADGLVGIVPPSDETAAQIHRFIGGYGATLVALPHESWNTSVCIWMGDHWDALIDLWTKEEGRSDLVMQVQVREIGDEYMVTVCLVYVP